MLRIVRVLAPNPGPFTLEGTNTWVVGPPPAAVIDPGPDQLHHLEAVRREAGSVGAILITHRHPDHAPGAERLGAMTGVQVHAFRPGQGQERLRDNELVTLGMTHLRVIHTPGHTADHVSFLGEGTGALFTGDTVLGRGTAVIDPPEGDLAMYIESLRRLRSLRPGTIYPGHGPTVVDGQRKLDEYLDHRAIREDQVVAALRDGLEYPEEIVSRVYADTPRELRGIAARQVLAQLIKLKGEGRALSTDGLRFRLVDERHCERCGRPAPANSRLCRRCSLDLLQENPDR